MSNETTVAFNGVNRVPITTHTRAGNAGNSTTLPRPSTQLRELLARLQSLDRRALDALATDLAQPLPQEPDDQLVALVAGSVREQPLPAADRHIAFLVQQFALREELRRRSISVAQGAKLLGVHRQTIHNHVEQGKLLGFRDGDRLRLPDWQFDATSPSGVLDGLPAVLAVLHAAPLAQARWFMLPQVALVGQTPATALRAGEKAAVVRAAARVGVS